MIWTGRILTALIVILERKDDNALRKLNTIKDLITMVLEWELVCQ